MGVNAHDQGQFTAHNPGIDGQGYTVVLLLNPIVQQLTQYGTYTRDSDEEPRVSRGGSQCNTVPL